MMNKKFRKKLSAVLAAALLTQSGFSALAEETAVQPVSETVAETQLQAEEPAPAAEPQAPATEAQTQAPATEAQTQAPATEAQTQAPATEAQTQAPATEAQTQAPATETQTQAPATEAQTQAPATEAQTQAPATEAQTQGAQSESSTEGQTEASAKKEKKEKKKKETERSDYENDGKKLTAKDTATELRQASPYLFAAETITASEELLEGQKTVQDETGAAIVSGLEDFSIRLADAKSSSDLEIINLYANEDGKLDEAQLKELSDDCIIDVSSKYFVVNVIADSAGQDLDFSGYDMLLSGQAVKYESGEQPGDIIYNFAAWDDGEFTGYEGTVTLSDASGLQGIFLAPEADVTIASDLAGAVYADTITVNDSVENLLKITFAQSTEQADAEETEISTEAKAETAAETDSEAAPESESPAEAETDSEAAAETDTEGANTESEAVTEAADTENEAITEVAEEIVLDTDEQETAESEEAAEEAAEEVPVGEEILIVEDGELTATLLAEGGAAPSALAEEGDAAQPSLLAETDTTFEVSLSDAADSSAVAGTVSIKAAQDIKNGDGTVVYAEDAVVESYTFTGTAAETHEFGTALTYAGDYYMEVTGLPETYLAVSRTYFNVGAQGLVLTAADWQAGTQLLNIQLYKKDVSAGVPVIEVTDENGAVLTGAVFVVKDRDGKIIRSTTTEGYPQHYIEYAGVQTALTGLAAGEYILSQIKASEGSVGADGAVTPGEYRIADDIAFQVPSAAGAEKIAVVNTAVLTGGKKLTVSAQAYYSTVAGNADTKTNVLLTAEQDQSYYFAAFTKDAAGVKRISEVQELTIAAGLADSAAGLGNPETSANAAAVISGLADGTYYLAATDEFGELLNPETIPYRLQETDAAAAMTQTPIAIGEQDTEKTAVLQYIYQNGQYPENEFSYMADIVLTMDVIGHDGKAYSTEETFYASIFSDAALTAGVTAAPMEFKMGGASTKSVTYQIKMTAAQGNYYAAQTNESGKVIMPADGFAYAITYPDSDTGVFTVTCGQTAAVKIQDKLNDSVVKLSVVNSADNRPIAGAVIAIKNSSGRVIAINNAKTFESKDTAIELKNLLEDGQKYYLSEIQAPDGYTAAPDVQFTVKSGSTTEVVLKNTATASTSYQLTVSKQVYAGEHQVYAYDSTNKTYSKAGAYTFYAALFSDAKHTKKVSDVQKITVSGFGGTTAFKNLEHGKTYYLAETTQYGEVYKSSTSTRTIKYSDSGKIVMNEKSKSAIIQNVYNKLPGGYRYTGTLTIKKQVTDASDKASAVTSTFYAGIYRKADFSDTPTIVKLELKNSSTASVKRRILLSGEEDMTYYIAEVDSKGNRITDESEFAYMVSIDQPEAKVSKGADKVVTITNKVKTSKATLYLTKKVYEGSELKKVNETFYAGLFKDAEFTELYTKPIALKLENKSELTLKLSLNLGNSSKATIYIAEVDKDGKVIKNQRTFGYEVKIINSTAAFTQERLEIQTILVNSVYGSSSEEEWNNIYDNELNNSNYSGGYSSGYLSDNGEASYDESGVDTGDETPVGWYLGLLGASLLILIGIFVRRKRKAQ